MNCRSGCDISTTSAGSTRASTAHPGAALRVLLVGGDGSVRAAVSALCRHEPDVQLVGEAASGIAGINAAEMLRPDVMLLELPLTDMAGIDVVRATRRKDGPAVILIAEDGDDAMRAFGAETVDCVLKPISVARLRECLERARQRCLASAMNARVARGGTARQPAAAAAASAAAALLNGERGQRSYPLSPEQIDYISACGNYVKMHAEGREYLSRDSIKRLAATLAPAGFVRIERSILINVHAIRYVERLVRGTYAFTLKDGAYLRSGATYRAEILRMLGLRRLTPPAEQER
jgi:two-component system, LytTR family, response regulator